MGGGCFMTRTGASPGPICGMNTLACSESTDLQPQKPISSRGCEVLSGLEEEEEEEEEERHRQRDDTTRNEVVAAGDIVGGFCRLTRVVQSRPIQKARRL
ncbi:hypothetical protein RRG08_028318 [Elysia crispata]|uniref:Uncharacterized protein n=1 Tax=Elysia crispata TaxID=231223 RepID=A0AAE1AYB2_9GAST|nr:hypothetical protein RRG08_028318 [Elysia crispata]